MNVVRYKELEKAEFELQSKFSSKDVMFFRRGDGIDNQSECQRFSFPQFISLFSHMINSHFTNLRMWNVF